MPEAGGGPDSVWRQKAGLGDAELDGERVLWDPETGRVARLDRIGSLVWACLDGESTLGQVADDLAAAFGAPADVVAPDVSELVARLSAMGLVIERGSPGP